MTNSIWVTLVLGIFLVSCQQAETSESNPSIENPENAGVLPIQPLQIVSPYAFRMSYIGRTQTDTSFFYQVLSSYDGRAVGFNLSIPRGHEAVAYFSTRGEVSDDLLRVLQKMYQLPVDSTARFKAYVKADFFNLADVYKADSGWMAGYQSKLFFPGGSDTADIPEIHLNVNEKEHWIELVSDSMYRAGLVRSLTQK
jgi:hypothetical protein